MLIVAYLLIALATVLVLALPFLQRGKPRDEAALTGGLLGDLHAEKATILAAIRDLELERQSGKVGEEDYAEFLKDYETRAAQVLQRVDAAEAATAESAAEGGRAAARKATAATGPALRGMLPYAVGGVVLLAVGVSAGYLLATYSQGNARPQAPVGAPAPPASPQIAALESALARNPDDVKAKLALAHAYLDANRFGEAIPRYRQVLDKNPHDPEALTHMGVILVQAGHADAALQMFDRALAADPKYVHALWDKANLLFEQRQDYAGAAKTLEAFVALAAPGPDVERAKTMIAEAKKRQAEPKPAAESPAPAAPSERQSLR